MHAASYHPADVYVTVQNFVANLFRSAFIQREIVIHKMNLSYPIFLEKKLDLVDHVFWASCPPEASVHFAYHAENASVGASSGCYHFGVRNTFTRNFAHFKLSCKTQIFIHGKEVPGWKGKII